MGSSTVESKKNIQSLIESLDDPSWKKRKRARLELMESGKAGLAALVSGLNHPNVNVRWQAAKALSRMQEPATAPALVRVLLEEEDFGIRWMATEGLAGMGQDGLAALLESLMEHADSIWLRDGTRHVLHILHDVGLETEATRKVLAALQGIEPAVTVPKLAMDALEDLKKQNI